MENHVSQEDSTRIEAKNFVAADVRRRIWTPVTLLLVHTKPRRLEGLFAIAGNGLEFPSCLRARSYPSRPIPSLKVAAPKLNNHPDSTGGRPKGCRWLDYEGWTSGNPG
jgi:hypothetical protein